MKKPLLSTLGLAGACAACCAIPILVPLVSGLSVAGLIGFNWEQLSGHQNLVAVAAASAAASLMALGIWTVRRRRANACGSRSAVQNEKTRPAPSCGCSGAPKSPSTAGVL